jgi:hypothetical protein
MRFRTFVGSISLLALASVSLAQDAMNMLGGAGNALTLKPDGLANTFKAVQIKSTSGGQNGLLDMIMSPMMMIMGAFGGMAGGEKSDGPPFGLMAAMELSWTTGQTQQFFGQHYLVAYKLDLDMGKLASATKDFTDLDLRLHFIRADTIASFSPRPDITPAMFMQMLRTPPPSKPAEPPTLPPAEGGDGGGGR